MSQGLILALDGHDGAGKTSLAGALAERLGGAAVRPFAGAIGAQLLRAGERKAVAELVRIGVDAIHQARASVPAGRPVILDRGWMTVASFVPDSAEFFSQWQDWFPTTLCWVDLPTTLERLALRPDEDAEALDWHQHYLHVYRDLAHRSGSPILRTDQLDFASCLEHLSAWAARPQAPVFASLA